MREAKVVLIVLFIIFLETVFVNIDNLKWEIAILPISIVLMALGLKFLRLDREETNTKEESLAEDS